MHLQSCVGDDAMPIPTYIPETRGGIMIYRVRGIVVAICMLSAWLGLWHVSGPSCQAQQQEAETGLEESYERGGDPPPPGAVVHVEESDLWHPEKVRWAAFSPDSDTLFSFVGETLFRWEVPQGKLVSKTTFDGIGASYPVKISPDGQVLVSVESEEDRCHLWNMEDGSRRFTLGGLDEPQTLIGFSPDSKLLLTKQFRDGSVYLWGVESGEKVREWDSGEGLVRATRILSDGRTLLTVNDDHTVRRWDYTSGELLEEKSLVKRIAIQSAEFSPDGRWLAVAAPRDEVGRVYDLETGQEVFELRYAFDGYSQMSVVGFLPNGSSLITNSTRNVFTLWEVPSGEPKLDFRAEAENPFISPDGRWLAVQPDRHEWGREIQLWELETGRQISTPRMRTYFRPVLPKLAASDPMQVAIHWAGSWGQIPAVGRYVGRYSPSSTIETMELRVVTPSGKEYHLHPKITHRNAEPSAAQIPHRSFPALPSIFLELSDEGFNTVVLGHAGSWDEVDRPSFDEPGEYRLSVSGSIMIEAQQPIAFQTAETTISREAEGVLPIEEIRREAVAKLREVLGHQATDKILPDKGGHGEYDPLDVIGLPTHERVVLLAVEQPSSISGGRAHDQYRVVVEPDGTVVEITHEHRQTCLAAGTPVDTEHGPRPIEQLRPGDRVWSFDLESGRPLLTTVQAIHHGEVSAVLEINSILSATAEHPVYANGEWIPAGRLRQGDLVIGRDESHLLAITPRLLSRRTAVLDLTVDEPHNFFAGGLLVHNKSEGLAGAFFDRWRLFHVAASPYANQVATRGNRLWIVGLAFALIAAGISIYALRRRGAIAPTPSRVPVEEL